jgi:hypothetical protein
MVGDGEFHHGAPDEAGFSVDLPWLFQSALGLFSEGYGRPGWVCFCRYRSSWIRTALATASVSSLESAPIGRSSRRLLAVVIWSAMALRRSPLRLTYASAG